MNFRLLLADHRARSRGALAACAARCPGGDHRRVLGRRLYQAARSRPITSRYAAQTGIKVISVDADNPATPIKAMVEAGNVTVDVATSSTPDAVRLCDEGLLEEIDHSILPPAPTARRRPRTSCPGALTDCVVAPIVYSTSSPTTTTKFADKAPTTIADFFDIEKFPGKRGMRKGAKVNLEMALMADGVPAAEVYDVLAHRRRASIAPSPSSTPSRTTWSGGRPAPSRRSCSPTARSR